MNQKLERLPVRHDNREGGPRVSMETLGLREEMRGFAVPPGSPLAPET